MFFHKIGDGCMITAEKKNGKLIITADMQKPEMSKSGKSLVVATSKGNVKTDLIIDGKPVIIGLNAYFSVNN